MTRLFSKKRPLPLVLGGLLLAAGGCQAPGPIKTVDGGDWVETGSRPAPQLSDYVEIAMLGATRPSQAKQSAVRNALEDAWQEPLKTRALALADVGIAAAHLGAISEAREALDGALDIMEAVIYDPAKSREIESLPGEERTKIFKGEPHERAMCNLYRGLIYLADADYEAARACFRRADMDRARVEDNGSRDGEWLSLEYLTAVSDALCPSQLGIEWMRAVPEDLQLDPYLPGDNVLMVVMSGGSPGKVHRQGGNEHGLAYRRGPGQVATVRIVQNPEELTLPQAETSFQTISTGFPPAPTSILELTRPTEDLFLQAVSNGRREVDKLLAAKQQAADTSAGCGDASETIGMVIAGIPYVNLALYPLLIIGSVGRGTAAGTDSTADLRSIVGPGLIHIATLEAISGRTAVQVTGDSGNLLGENHVTIRPDSNRRLQVVLVRVYR